MKAGASSVWASCCGLLNEVMGSGAVRGQQPGFGPAAGPFRFAPSATYSTYPPTSSGSVGPTCKACGLAFSVFRRKHICCDCKKDFCALCSVLQENLRRCTTCHLLRGTAFQRPQLMRLRVKDLRQYLQLRNIPTDTCREKEDLVELVLCHQRASCGHGAGDDEEEEEEEEETEDDEEEEEEEERNGGSLRLQAPRPPESAASPSTCEQTGLSAPQGVPLSRSDSSGTSDQDEDEDDVPVALMNLDPDKDEEAGPLARGRERTSLSDLSSEQDIGALTVRQLKEILTRNFVNYSGCCEKWELVERVCRLYRHAEQNRKSLEGFSNSITADGERLLLAGQDDNLCRICMDAMIDCVLLECGHMVTCTKCGKRMNECPICRQYVVRAVHVFKS
ncbi:E3 ubiquitin-protein ligase RNF34-like isoform X2 [Scleropages formosus]|uniref:RING-type E3 ubiquitin transferase n=1 Tax=Scleropages formosus TaxID=113540 RepID=A0A8C9RUS1_SCLFO|nr:E3 ubiquitin-protein ligase RNF34-like isoform X2 [Scleropages formosus]